MTERMKELMNGHDAVAMDAALEGARRATGNAASIAPPVDPESGSHGETMLILWQRKTADPSCGGALHRGQRHGRAVGPRGHLYLTLGPLRQATGGDGLLEHIALMLLALFALTLVVAGNLGVVVAIETGEQLLEQVE